MINFFRKIRRNLADNNQFFKYSRYAIGEIVLVVIGILIALSINNWNEERKQHKKHDRMLLKVKEELKTNIENHSELLQTYSYIDSIMYLVNNRLFRKEDLERSNSSVKTIYGWYPFEFYNEAYNNYIEQDFNETMLNDSILSLLKTIYNIHSKNTRKLQDNLIALIQSYADEMMTSKTWSSKFHLEWSDDMYEYFLTDPFYYNHAERYSSKLYFVSTQTENLRINELKAYGMLNNYFNEKDTLLNYKPSDYKLYKGVFKDSTEILQFKEKNGKLFLHFEDEEEVDVREVYPITSTSFVTGWKDGHYHLVLDDNNQVVKLRGPYGRTTKDWGKVE